MECKTCKNEVSEGLLMGYCIPCAEDIIEWYGVLKANLDVALEPVRHWYGEDKRPIVHVIADIVADLQKDRADVLRLKKEVAQARQGVFGFMIKTEETLEEGMQRNYAEFDSCRKELCDQIVKLETAELRRVAELHEVYTSKAVFKRNLHETRSQIIKLCEWCEKRFSVSIPDLLNKEDWPNTICEVVIKVINERTKKPQTDLQRTLRDLSAARGQLEC